MQESPPDLLTRIVAYVVAFVGVGGLAGYLQYRLAARRAPVDMQLASAQTDTQRATAEEIRARVRRADEDSIVGNLRAGMQELRSDIERLRADRDYWRERAEKAERRNLEEALDEGLPPRRE